MATHDRDDAAPDAKPGESFVQRVSRRKLEARRAQTLSEAPPVPVPSEDAEAPPVAGVPAPQLTDADMPPLEALNDDSDYSGFLSDRVSEGLRKAALRKLFHAERFNVIDELDDYAEDFTAFAALGDLVTSDVRHQLEVEARRVSEAMKQSALGAEDQAKQVDEVVAASDADREEQENEQVSSSTSKTSTIEPAEIGDA